MDISFLNSRVLFVFLLIFGIASYFVKYSVLHLSTLLSFSRLLFYLLSQLVNCFLVICHLQHCAVDVQFESVILLRVFNSEFRLLVPERLFFFAHLCTY